MITKRGALSGAAAFLLGCCMLLWSGCSFIYQAPVKPPPGTLFAQYKAPLTTDFDKTPVGRDVKKVSTGRTFYFLDFLLTGQSFAWDDASIDTIAREGGIDQVSYADYEILWILGIYAEYRVHVHGK